MTEAQRNLFPLPRPKRIELTPIQHEVLAWVEYTDGWFTAWPRRFKTATLRMLIELKLVEVIAYGPARYRVTPLGRAVRVRHSRHHGAPRPAGLESD
jgi:hypothetical protein